MKKFAVRIEWSQTDHQTILVNATDVEHAKTKTMNWGPGIRYITSVVELYAEIS